MDIIDVSPFVEDSHRESKTLVLGGFITDDEGNILQEDYDDGTTLSIEMEEQVREIGTFPGFKYQPERRYKIKEPNEEQKKEGATREGVAERLYYSANRRSTSIEENREIEDKTYINIASFTDYKLERDANGIYGLDSRAENPGPDKYGEGNQFQDHYKNLKSRIHNSTNFQPLITAGILPLNPGINKHAMLPSTPKYNSGLKKEITRNVSSLDNKNRNPGGGKTPPESIDNQIIRHGFDGLTVRETLEDRFSGFPDINYVTDELVSKGKEGTELTKLVSTYTQLLNTVMIQPANVYQLHNFLNTNGIDPNPKNTVFIMNPAASANRGDVTYMHFIDNLDIGDGLIPEDGIDMDTVDNMRKPSSFLIMQAEETLAVKYVDFRNVGLDRMLLNLINDTALNAKQNIKNITVNKFEGKPSNPSLFRISASTIEAMANRFDKITISNSLVKIDLPENASITVKSLTLEHCTIVGNNSTINVKGDLGLVDCSFESATDEKIRHITFRVDGNVDVSDLLFKQAINITFGTDSSESTMTARNIKFKASYDKYYSPLLIVGFKDLSVIGVKRVEGTAPKTPLIRVAGCITILIMDVDNGQADFDTLIDVDAFNDLSVMNVTCEPLHKFNSVVKISNSSEEGKIKLAEFNVKSLSGLLYDILNCKLSTLKFDTIKSNVSKMGVIYNCEIEAVTFSECDIRLSTPVTVSYGSKKLTFSSTQLIAPELTFNVETALHFDNSMIRADKKMTVNINKDSRFSLMKSSLVAGDLNISRVKDATGDSVELTTSTVGGEGSKTAVIDSSKVVFELSYIIVPSLIIRNANSVDINDTTVRVNVTKNITLSSITNIKNCSLRLENGGALTVTTNKSKGKLSFVAASNVKLRRDTVDSITVDKHTVEEENTYKVSVSSTNCKSSAHLVDRKYLSILLDGKDFRLFRPISTVKMYAEQMSLNGGYDYIYYGVLEEPKEE